MKQSILLTASLFSLFLGSAMAEADDVTINITEPVTDYTAVKSGETTSGKLTVNVNGS